MNNSSVAENISQYTSGNHQLTPLNGKIPKLKNWPRLPPISDTELGIYARNGHNLGWVLGDCDLVVDVDPRNGGEESFARLEADLGIKLNESVKTPRGGFHCYLKHKGGLKLQKTLKGVYDGIDFLTQGSQCVIVGSAVNIKGKQLVYEWHEGNVFGCFTQHDAPQSILKLLEDKSRGNSANNAHGLVQRASEGIDGLDELVGVDNSYWTSERIRDLLRKLDPSMSNDEWVKVGMGLHSLQHLDGLPLWEEWSQDGVNYVPDECAKRWKSFSHSPDGISIGTVLHMVTVAEFSAKASDKDDFIESIENADKKTIETVIIPKIKRADMPEGDREDIAQVIKSRRKALTGTAMPIGIVRRSITPIKGDTSTETPEWCKGWVYVRSHKSFTELSNMESTGAEGFNMACGKRVPLSDNGLGKPTAVKYVADNGFLEQAHKMVYLPANKGVIIKIGNTSYLNTFDAKSVPKAADKFTLEGLEAIKLIKKHIEILCRTEERAHILTQWLAHQIQNTGELLRWAPLIQGIEGTGKSFMGRLLTGCLGTKNVGVVSPSTAIGKHNDFATGVAVNVLEELRVVGHNRYEAANAIKPLITDDMINVEPKFVSAYTTFNSTNYICFTNFKDAIPITSTDRRWWVIFIDVQDELGFAKRAGKEGGKYFDELNGAVKNHSDEINKWLLEYPITEEFRKTKVAPMTDEKRSMADTELAGFTGHNETMAMIRRGGKFFNEEAINKKELLAAVRREDVALDIRDKDIGFILKKEGYTAHHSVVRVSGDQKRYFVKDVAITGEQIRMSLESRKVDKVGYSDW